MEIITLQPQLTVIVQTWIDAIHKGWMGLQDFVLLLLQSRSVITDPHPKDLIGMLSQVRGSKQVEMYNGIGQGAINGVMVTTSIQGKSNNVVVDLPDMILMSTPLFVAWPAVEFTVDLTLNMQDKGIVVYLASKDLDDAFTRTFLESCETMRQRLPGVMVGLGTPIELPWHEIEE